MNRPVMGLLGMLSHCVRLSVRTNSSALPEPMQVLHEM